jgi:hypothetical protein
MSRRSARFEKVVLTPGKYLVAFNGSDRVEQEFTPERLERMAQTGQRMINNGLRIPIPFKHFDKDNHTPVPVTLSESGKEIDPITGKAISWDASINGGFAESFYQNEEGALVAVLESFGDENDLNTPAGKIGTTCQETSIGLASKYTDGKGNTYEDAPIHIAACIKAVEPGQTNFVLLGNEDVAKVAGDLSIVSMSSQIITMSDPPTSGSTENGDRSLNGDSDPEIDGKNLSADVPTLLNLLRKLESPIDLPDDTTDLNLVERLVIAVNQKICDEESEEEIEPGEGNATPQPPKQAQEKQGTYTMTTPASPVAPNQESVLLMSMLANTQKKTLEARIAKLKEKGIKDEMIEKFVTPHMGLDVTTMSMNDFNVATGQYKSFAQAELAISILEAQEPNVITMDLSQGIGYDPHQMTEVGYSEPNNVDAETAKAVGDFASLIQNGQRGFSVAN